MDDGLDEARAAVKRNLVRLDAEVRKRDYPSYTLAELKEWVAKGQGSPRVLAEIAAREAGLSEHKVTPQILGGKPINKIGRL